MPRGVLPADIILLGEAPGSSEDSEGHAFSGEAGYLLQDILYLADIKRYFLDNVVACLPKNPDSTSSGTKRPPNKKEISACQTRLLDLLSCAAVVERKDPDTLHGVPNSPGKTLKPSSMRDPCVMTIRSRTARPVDTPPAEIPIVAVGSVASQGLKGLGIPHRQITHPAAILRMQNASKQHLAIKKCVATLIRAVEK